MAQHYAERAAAIWKDADAGVLGRHLTRLRRLVNAQVPMARIGGLG
jgi:hypothetical protein